MAIWVFNCMRRGISYCHLTHKEETITQSNCNFIFFGPPRPLGKQTKTLACAEKELDCGLKSTMEIPPPITAHCCCGAVGLLLWCGMSRDRLCSPALLQSDTGPPAFHTDLSDFYTKRQNNQHRHVTSPDLFSSSCCSSIPKFPSGSKK